ncbi:unnamed protein product [Camellia sinensis]
MISEAISSLKDRTKDEEAATASIKESEKTDKVVVKNGEKTKGLSQVKTPEALKKKKKVSTPAKRSTMERGLSKHFQGKSQSFTSLANVRCLEDLAKPENPYNKRFKTCKSYGGLLDSHRSSSHLHLCKTTSSSRFISKGASSSSSSSSSRGSFSSLIAKRPPLIPAHRSTSTSSISNQTPLFA